MAGLIDLVFVSGRRCGGFWLMIPFALGLSAAMAVIGLGAGYFISALPGFGASSSWRLGAV